MQKFILHNVAPHRKLSAGLALIPLSIDPDGVRTAPGGIRTAPGGVRRASDGSGRLLVGPHRTDIRPKNGCVFLFVRWLKD